MADESRPSKKRPTRPQPGPRSSGRRTPRIRPTGVSRPRAAPSAAPEEEDSPGPDARERYMSIGDHLEELRKRLIAVAAVSVLAAVAASFFIYPIHDLIVKPYLAVVGSGRAQPVTLILRQVPGPLVSLLKLAAMVGMTLTLPVSISILWGFVRPALSRRAAWIGQAAVLASSGLFWLGILVCWRLVFPVALQFMLVDVLPSGVSPQLSLEDYYSFVFFLHIGAGLGFQLPLLVVVLGGLGILTIDWHRRTWRFTLVGIFIFSAVATPPDPITQLALAVPLTLLYIISVLIVWLIERGGRKAAQKAA